MISLLLAAAAASSPGPLLAVLEFKNKLPEADRKSVDASYFSDVVRAAALQSAPQVRVITRENLLVLLQSSGKKMEECEGECEVDTGRRIGADLVISGELLRVGSSLKLNLRLHDTHEGKLLSAALVSGRSVDELDEAAQRAAATLMAPLKSAAPPVPQGTPADELLVIDARTGPGPFPAKYDAGKSLHCEWKAGEGYQCHIDTDYDHGFHAWGPPTTRLQDNFEIELTIRARNPAHKQNFGIQLGRAPAEGGERIFGFAFELSNPASNGFINYTDGKAWRFLVDRRPVQARSDAAATLRIRVNGRRVRTWLNGAQFAVLDSPIPLDGAINFGCAGVDATFVVERMVVRDAPP